MNSYISYLKNNLLKKNNKPTVYIHIGTQKTGSSSIQQFLALNRKLLDKNNIIYPDFNTLSGDYIIRFFGFSNVRELEKFNLKYSRSQQMAFVDERMNKPAGKTKDIVLSAEGFSSVWFPEVKKRLNELKSYFKNRNVKIICYLRRQDHYLESSYNQVIKAGNTTAGISDYIKKRIEIGNCNYYSLLSLYAEFFGKENIIVRTFEPTLHNNEKIFSDFLDIIGIENQSDFRLPEKAINKSYSREMIAMMKTIPPEFRIRMLALLNQVELTRENSQYLTSPVERIKILEHFDQSNSLVAKVFCEKPDGKLFEEPWPSENEPWEQKEDEYGFQHYIPILLEIMLVQNDRILSLEKRLKQIATNK